MNPYTLQMQAFRAQGQSFAEAVMPAKISLGDQPRVYDVSTGGIRTSKRLGEDGLWVSVKVISFRLRKALHPIRPVENTRVSWVDGATDLRIKQVATGGLTDPSWLITCEGPEE